MHPFFRFKWKRMMLKGAVDYKDAYEIFRFYILFHGKKQIYILGENEADFKKIRMVHVSLLKGKKVNGINLE